MSIGGPIHDMYRAWEEARLALQSPRSWVRTPALTHLYHQAESQSNIAEIFRMQSTSHLHCFKKGSGI
jgi:hypothetical protein